MPWCLHNRNTSPRTFSISSMSFLLFNSFSTINCVCGNKAFSFSNKTSSRCFRYALLRNTWVHHESMNCLSHCALHPMQCGSSKMERRYVSLHFRQLFSSHAGQFTGVFCFRLYFSQHTSHDILDKKCHYNL